jgi:hypothetical protein
MKNASPDEGLAPGAKSGGSDDPRTSTPAAAPSTHHRKTNRTRAPQHPALAEPVKVADFWKNRRGETIRVSLETYEGRDLVDVRQYYTGKDGKMLPTKKGISLSVLRLIELAAAINKAVTKARDLALIENDEASP